MLLTEFEISIRLLTIQYNNAEFAVRYVARNILTQAKAMSPTHTYILEGFEFPTKITNLEKPVSQRLQTQIFFSKIHILLV